MMALSFPRSRKKLPPRLADGMRIYAIGDIHGRADLLDEVLDAIDADRAARPGLQVREIYLGDYVDRGPDSRGVLDRLLARSRTQQAVFLKGNHETYAAGFLNDPALWRSWQHFGGCEMLLSYGLTPPRNATAGDQAGLAAALARVMPESHRRFLGGLQPSFACGDFFFVHAGVRPGRALTKQRQEDLLSIREDFLFCERDFGKVVVHGHTPSRLPEVHHNRINIDTGAYATGRLTCLRLEADTMNFYLSDLAGWHELEELRAPDHAAAARRAIPALLPQGDL
jgi:serine/threonine protein phosphatase 1